MVGRLKLSEFDPCCCRASWFVIYGAMSIIFAVMFTLVMHYMAVLQNINVVVLFLLFTLFGFSIITFAFSLTPFFHKPKVGLSTPS